MIEGKQVIAIIPARSGSKGLKDKNILDFMGENLLQRTVRIASEVQLIDFIIVSSDSDTYLNSLHTNEKLIKSKRPKELSEDNSSIIDVIIYCINSCKLISTDLIIVLLQPTSPLRKSCDIENALILFTNKKLYEIGTVVSVSEPFNALNTFYKTEGEKLGLDRVYQHTFRQDFSKMVAANGCVYISSWNFLNNKKSFYTENTYYYQMSKLQSIDIDDEVDYKIAIAIAKHLEGEGNEA